jgi:hypothetical protein
MLQKKLLLLPLIVTGVLVTVSAAIESTLGLSALVHSLAVLEEAAVEEASNSQWYQREGS